MGTFTRRRWTRTVLAALFVAAFGITGCKGNKKQAEPDQPKAPDAWKIGAYLSLSGAETQFGIETKEGIELATEEINKAGGVKGRPFKVLYEDDKTNPNEASNKVLQLIDRDKVVALLGEVSSSRSMVGGLVANRKKVPMISPLSTHPEVTQIGPFVFRVCFTDDIQGRMSARFVVNTLGKKKLAILFTSDDIYSSGLAHEFKEEAKKLGAEIVAEKSFLETETNFTTYITEIRDANPEIIYAPIYYTAMVPIARQAKAAGVAGSLFMGGDGWDAVPLLTDAGEELEGALFTNHYAPDVPWPNAQAFRNAFREKFQRDPSTGAAMGYDATKVLADAISRSKEDTPDSIREAIGETKNFRGATGTITIDEKRNADKPLVVVQIKNRKYVYHSTIYEGAKR